MTEFASLPPSRRSPPPEGFFQGGMMPATAQDVAALIILDIRSLGLSVKQGRKLEQQIRDFAVKQLRAMKVDIADRSAIDLSTSVFGISIE